jgi:hypothetical protein
MFCWLCISIHPFVMKTNLMHCLSSVYFVIQPLHVSGIFVSGGILYMYNNWYVLCFLVDSLLAGWPTDNETHNENQQRKGYFWVHNFVLKPKTFSLLFPKELLLLFDFLYPMVFRYSSLILRIWSSVYCLPLCCETLYLIDCLLPTNALNVNFI